jgi:integrase
LESTWAAYRNAVGHLVGGLGGGSLRLLSPLGVERFEHRLLASGRGLVDGRIEIGPPKSASSRRLVALDTTTTAVLSDYLEQRAGPVWVFPGEGDRPLNPASFSTTFDRLVARAGVATDPGARPAPHLRQDRVACWRAPRDRQ